MEPIPSSDSNLTPGIMQAVEDSQHAGKDEEQKTLDEKEQNVVKQFFKDYEQGRKFDEPIRKQYAVDRRYAAGTADLTWAVTTNLIGSFIDILTSFLYARNPDVSCKKAEQVDNSGTKEMDDFAKTMQLIISRLWKKSSLKRAVRKQVRSVLSIGVGWLKVILICDSPKNPQMQDSLKDIRAKIADLQAARDALDAIPDADPEEVDAKIAKQKELEDSITNRVEAAIKKYLAVDFIAAQNMQTSLDIESTEDYTDADWNGNCIYVLKSELKSKFPRLTDTEIKEATCYYQKVNRDLQPLTDVIVLNGDQTSGIDADAAENYIKGSATTNGSGSDQGPEFAKVIEQWDKRTDHIKTGVEGVKRWALEPYEPPYATSRFYPYFRLSFYEVDGARHPQSLSWRLHKLQDEYARSRSNFRLTRERSIPGVIFNSGGITPEDAAKIQQSVHQEMVGINPLDAQTPIQNLFAPKPVASVDGRLFDNSPILADMEKVGGVQEALQSSVTTPKTATEAGIQQSGFASRTTADRDLLEDMLTDLANYTGELALGGLKTIDAQRIAGKAAFWPSGMSVDDIITMVEIEIEAGSTGKPHQDQDKQAWGVILPAVKEALAGISQAITAGDVELAKAISELVKETMVVMGYSGDPSRFVPAIPDSLPPPAPPVPEPPKVSISLKGILPPELSAPLAAGAVQPHLAPTPGSGEPAPSADGGDPTLPPSAGDHAGAGAGSPELPEPSLENPTI